MSYYIGQRLSLKSQACTVRFIGPVSGKPGEWLGVEWDDTIRGKHDGAHDGVRYFDCKSASPTAGSFLKPTQSWDTTKTFLEALREKYMPADPGFDSAAVYFSSKQAEEVGFDKFAKRQAQLQGIFVLVLDRMCIRGHIPGSERGAIESICANITELDLSGNLFETLDEVADICSLLPKLRRLVLDDNRFLQIDPSSLSRGLDGVQTLSVSNTLLTWAEISSVARLAPKLTSLTAARNELVDLCQETFPAGLRTLDLAGNGFKSFADLAGLNVCSQLESLILKHNHISKVDSHEATRSITPSRILNASISDLDLAYNDISAWSLLHALPQTFPAMKQLRVTGNPVYMGLKAANGAALTVEDGYMLTIARLPQLKTLNYAKITEKERLNSETYYLGQIATQLSLTSAKDSETILAEHPRWKALCEEYGEPTVHQRPEAGQIDPNSLAARLVRLSFTLEPRAFPQAAISSWSDEIPKSANIYFVLGHVGRKLRVAPLQLRLVWMTGEQDPVGREVGQSEIEWWDSSDDESDRARDKAVLVAREVELVAGTRPLGSYIDGRAADIRVERSAVT